MAGLNHRGGRGRLTSTQHSAQHVRRENHMRETVGTPDPDRWKHKVHAEDFAEAARNALLGAHALLGAQAGQCELCMPPRRSVPDLPRALHIHSRKRHMGSGASSSSSDSAIIGSADLHAVTTGGSRMKLTGRLL